MDEEVLSAFEKRLLNEIAIIETQIKELEISKTALHKLRTKASAERTGIQNVTRKNSVNRVLAENSVIKLLQKHKKPLSTKELYKNALYTNYDLKESTFRNYLHRMKKKGLVELAGHVGLWQLPITDNFS